MLMQSDLAKVLRKFRQDHEEDQRRLEAEQEEHDRLNAVAKDFNDRQNRFANMLDEAIDEFKSFVELLGKSKGFVEHINTIIRGEGNGCPQGQLHTYVSGRDSKYQGFSRGESSLPHGFGFRCVKPSASVEKGCDKQLYVKYSPAEFELEIGAYTYHSTNPHKVENNFGSIIKESSFESAVLKFSGSITYYPENSSQLSARWIMDSAIKDTARDPFKPHPIPPLLCALKHVLGDEKFVELVEPVVNEFMATLPKEIPPVVQEPLAGNSSEEAVQNAAPAEAKVVIDKPAARRRRGAQRSPKKGSEGQKKNYCLDFVPGIARGHGLGGGRYEFPG